MTEIFQKVTDWYDSTNLHEQIIEVDIVALFSNPWFLVPFATLIVYMIYKQNWKDIIIITVIIGVWWASGTEYMDTLIVNGEVQIEKILPVVFGGAAALGFVLYLLFGRSD